MMRMHTDVVGVFAPLHSPDCFLLAENCAKTRAVLRAFEVKRYGRSTKLTEILTDFRHFSAARGRSSVSLFNGNLQGISRIWPDLAVARRFFVPEMQAIASKIPCKMMQGVFHLEQGQFVQPSVGFRDSLVHRTDGVGARYAE
jgi:hypothetical protein